MIVILKIKDFYNPVAGYPWTIFHGLNKEVVNEIRKEKRVGF
jgi:hypothetical protein